MTAYTEGTVEYVVGDQTFHTWYRLYGEITPNSRTLIGLHGGPGIISSYLAALSDVCTATRPFLMYDQVGNGKSTRLTTQPASLFTIELFTNELANIIKKLGIVEYDLYGHSWGGILALEYELGMKPEGLRTIVLSNSMASTALWGKSTMELAVATGDASILEGLKAGLGDRKAGRAALNKLHALHGCLVTPWPKEFVDGIDSVYGDMETGEGGDPTVTKNMNLGGWTVIERLDQVRVPALILNGPKDVAQDFVVAPLFWGIKKSKWVTIAGTSHLPMLEQREKFSQILRDWLDVNGKERE